MFRRRGQEPDFVSKELSQLSFLLSHTRDTFSSRILFSKSRLFLKIKAVEGSFWEAGKALFLPWCWVCECSFNSDLELYAYDLCTFQYVYFI